MVSYSYYFYVPYFLKAFNLLNELCISWNAKAVWAIAYIAIFSVSLFVARGVLIFRLQDQDFKAYRDMGKPSYSDLFLTKAGRALLLFLVKGRFRAYEDWALVVFAWATLLVLFLGYLVMLLIFLAAAYCAY